MISAIHQEAQRVTRFSDLMMGQGSTSNTATEATIQQQQGNSATDQKKGIFQITLQEMAEYILGIAMGSYTEAKAFRLTEDKDEYVWIDMRDLTKVPAMKPITVDSALNYKRKAEEFGNVADIPEWEILKNDSTGEPITKNVDLDIEINVGAGLPKNKAFLWDMVQKLSTMFAIDKNAMKRTVVSYEELREFIKKFLGMPLEDDQINSIMQNPMPNNIPNSGETININADNNLSANGNPLMSSLPKL
jgi:hypothetical protein